MGLLESNSYNSRMKTYPERVLKMCTDTSYEVGVDLIVNEISKLFVK